MNECGDSWVMRWVRATQQWGLSPCARAAIIAAVGMAALPGQVLAQPPTPDYRADLGVTIGNSHVYVGGDQDRGGGMSIGAEIAVRPFVGKLKGLGFEGQALRLSDRSDGGPSPAEEFTGTLLTGGVGYYFRPETTVQPFLHGGAAFMRAEYRYALPVAPAGAPVGFAEDISASGVAWGGGVKLVLARRLLVRPQVTVASMRQASVWTWTWIQGQIGVGVRF